MRYNPATLDKYLLAFFIGLGMVAAGLSSTDRGWIVIGGVVIGITLLFAAIDIHGRIRGSRQESAAGDEPSRLRVLLMLPICLAIAGGLFVLGGTEGIVTAVVLLVGYGLVLLVEFAPLPAIKLGSLTLSSPPATGVLGDDPTLFPSMTGDPKQDEETLRRYLAERPKIQSGPAWDTLNELTSGRLEEAVRQTADNTTVERKPEGFHVSREVRLDLSNRDVLKHLVSVLRGQPATPSPSADEDAPDSAQSFFMRAEEFRARGMEAEAKKAYEEAEVRAIIDWSGGAPRDRGLLPTVLMRLGKLEEARRLLDQALAQTPADERLLAAKEALDMLDQRPG